MSVRRAAVVVLACLAAACERRGELVRVGFVFGDSWALGPVQLTVPEQERIRARALATLRQAYSGFAIEFDEDTGRDRLIRLNRQLFGSGSTQFGSRISDVNLDGVYLTLLAVTGCHDIAGCDAYPRAVLVDALGRGIGATAAHELGHQAGLRFVRESSCDDCFDSVTSTTRVHFFGDKHWSDEAQAAMRRLLPPAH